MVCWARKYVWVRDTVIDSQKVDGYTVETYGDVLLEIKPGLYTNGEHYWPHIGEDVAAAAWDLLAPYRDK
jgi:hypothetical protein